MFRIWALASLVLMLHFCSSVRADEAEDQAVAQVEKLGGRVDRNERLPGRPVTRVSLTGPKVTDADLRALVAFKDLAYLELSFAKVTDAGLKELATLKSLRDGGGMRNWHPVRTALLGLAPEG